MNGSGLQKIKEFKSVQLLLRQLMQELKSISTPTESLTVPKALKGVSGVAYDPLGEAVFVISSINSGSQIGAAISKIPDGVHSSDAAWEHHNSGHLSSQEEMKSKESEGVDPSSTLQKSLFALRNEISNAASEAYPKDEAKKQCLPPYLIGQSAAGKQIFTTDTYHEPDCLRFCPSNSSEHIEISLSGFTVRAKAPNQVARTNKAFTEGVHYWEIICPISLSTLLIGVSNKNSKEEITQQFRTTTPRVVGIEINFEKQTLNFWLNGRYIKERVKKITPGQKWYPIVKFKEADYFVVINPFAQGRGFTQEETNSNFLPSVLKSNEQQLFASYLSSQLQGTLLTKLNVVQTKNEDDKAIDATIRKMLHLEENNEVALHYKQRKPDEESHNIAFSLIKFANDHQALQFFHKNKDLKLYNPRQISSFVLATIQKNELFSKQSLEKTDLPAAISSDVFDTVFQEVLNQDQVKEIRLLSGITQESKVDDFAKCLTALKESIDKGELPKASPFTQDKPQEETEIQYLNATDKLLLVNDSELKLLSRQNGEFPMTEHSTCFTNQIPSKPEAEIRLDLSLHSLLILLNNLDWSMIPEDSFDILSRFFYFCHQHNTHKTLQIPYSLALIAVKVLLNVAITQYEQLEQSFELLGEQEILHKFTPSSVQSKLLMKEKSQQACIQNQINLPFEFGCVTLVDTHQLLSILLKLEDQLWAMIQTDEVPSSVKDLWASKSASRIHTAYGRLSSLITLPGSQFGDSESSAISLSQLADLGLVNTADKYGKLQHFQEFRTELENVFQLPSLTSQELQLSLERQFPQNLLFKGFPSWNVPLTDTLNSLPPQQHSVQHQAQQVTKVIQSGDFLFTADNVGGLNVWNTQLKLQKVLAHDVKVDMAKEKGGSSDNEVMMRALLMQDNRTSAERTEVRLIHSSSSQNHKKDQQIMQQTMQQSVVSFAQPSQLATNVEDILFTMFEEQPDTSNQYVQQEPVELSECDDNEDLNMLLHDYYEGPQIAAANTSAKPKAQEEEIKEEVKEQPPKKSEKPQEPTAEKEKEKPVVIEPKEDLLQQLVAMGFPLELSKKGLIKVKNESVVAAVDAVMELQEQEQKKKPKAAGKVQIVSYACEVCTFQNADGKAVCEVCGTAAPQTAYVIVKSPQEIEKEKQEEEARIKKELDEKDRVEKERIEKEELEKKRLEEERLRKEKEEEEAILKDLLKVKTQAYIDNAEVVDHIFASVKGCLDSKPFIAGTVFKSSIRGTHDIHLVRVAYRSTYLKQFVNTNAGIKPRCQVCDLPFNNRDQCISHVLKVHKDLLEAYHPVFIGNQHSQKSFDVKSNRINHNIMKTEFFGTIVLPFEHLDYFIQIGDNITEMTPLFIVCVGRLFGQEERQVFIQKVELNGPDSSDLTLLSVEHQKDSMNFLGISNLSTSSVTSLTYDSVSKLLLVTSGPQNDPTFLAIEPNLVDFVAYKTEHLSSTNLTISPVERILGLKQGSLYLQDKQTHLVRKLDMIRSSSSKKRAADSAQKIKEEEKEISERDILAMQINEESVSVTDIRRYEKLMSGKAVLATSNASHMMGEEQPDKSNNKRMYTKHHWTIDQADQTSKLELEFENPTSLIALNIELNFNCRDANKLFDSLKTQMITLNKSVSSQKQQSIKVEEQKVQSEIENDVVQNLGLLSIHGQSTLDATSLALTHQSSTAENSKLASQTFLPLVVDHHKGASYNQGFQVCRVVMDNDKIFASNYPRPEFFFKHLQGHSMSIDKFVIRSQTISKCGAFPIGSGIVFGADHLSAFEKTYPFHKFTKQDYQEWRAERLKDPSPLKPYEPIAYFEFDTETSLQFEPDCQRTFKYIFLKPTGFRKKPNSFSQNMSLAPLEIEFFGAIGSSIEDQNYGSSASLTDQDSAIQEHQGYSSKYDLELNVLQDGKTLKVIKDLEVQTVIGFDQPLSSKTLLASSKLFERKHQLIGRTFLKITDSHLQLQEVKGLQLVISNSDFNNDNWQLRGVSAQGIVAGDESSSSTGAANSGLFGKPEIPLSYMRSCLLSPKFYNVVNRVLAKMVSKEEVNQSLRQTIIQFLCRILKLDKDFSPLILEDLNIASFIRSNLFLGDPSGIQLVIEFLQNFQRDVTFCSQLYNILLDYIEQVPDKFLNYHGYEALIGLLKWSIPINPEKTLSHLMNVLFNKIVANKLPQLQTNEYIQFRSRFNFHTFPFDQVTFKTAKSAVHGAQNRKDNSSAASESANRYILPLNQMKRLKYDSHHIYEVEFATPNLIVTDLRIFLGLLQGVNPQDVQYKLIVKVFGENDSSTKETLLYFNTFEEQIFAQFANSNSSTAPTKQNSQNTDYLHIPNLAIHSQKLKLVIEYGCSYSTMPKGASPKIYQVESLVEFYGHSSDPNESQSALRALLDKKAQEYWLRSNTKLYSYGKSIKMLHVYQDACESLLVPQGSQSTTSAQSPAQEKEEIAIESSAPIQLHQELALLQEELKGKLRAQDPNIKEIVDKISQVHSSLEKYENASNNVDGSSGLINSLEYYMTVSSDITKIIRSIVKTKKHLIFDQINTIMRQVGKDLSEMSFEIFKRFVVYDQGPHAKHDALQFIIDCMYQVMTKEEVRAFIFKIIEEFLSYPQSIFSQRAVLESLTQLGIPEGELISFMIHKLNIRVAGKELVPYTNGSASSSQIQPFVFMSSVLILALNSLKQISIPEPGQALHKGISCSLCHSKHIVGWRYKCGHCPGNTDFCSGCVNKHLADNTEHVMLIIQEPLPYNTKQALAAKVGPVKASHVFTAPILPNFEFKEPGQSEDVNAAMTHDGFNCENCGKKPVIGNLYKCANCEDYNLCEQCYTKNQYNHFNYHVFMKLQKPLKQVEKNPTSLLQLLDPRLYPESQLSTVGESPSKKKEVQIEEEEDFEDLQPLNLSRSLSQPMAQKVQKNVHQQDQDKLDSDQQFVILFHTCVWITQDPQIQRFTKEEKIILLKLNIETMLQLIKLTSVKHILEVVSSKEAFFQLLVGILQLNSKDLITLFKSLFESIRQPPSLQRKIKEDKLNKEESKQDAKVAAKHQLMLEEQSSLKKLLHTLISHMQTFLKWLIDLGLVPEMAKLQSLQGTESSWTLLLQSYSNQRVWLDHLSLVLEQYIKSNDEIKEQAKSSGVAPANEGKNGKQTSLEKIPEEPQVIDGGIDNDEDLVPLTMARSISVPVTPGQRAVTQQSQQTSSLSLIKSLVQLLYINDPSSSNGSNKHMAKNSSHFRETESQTKYLSHMWSLVLKSLTTVSVNQLIEAKIFDALVNAFLVSSEEIKQITYPQILSITEIIATQSVHTNDISKFICNLLFITLENVTDNHHEKVGYSICQGWLDILISASTSRPAAFETSKTVHGKMNGEELSIYLRKTSQYLIQYLNRCSFEGPTGSNLQVMMRLNLACDLLYVIRHAENKSKPGSLAIQELIQQIATVPKLKKEFTEGITNLLAWVFLNARQAKDDQITSQLGNSSTLTPATAKIKQMTEYVDEIFLMIGETEKNETAVKIALCSMTKIVKRVNKVLIDLTANNQIGFDLSVRLSERTNEYFTKLLGQWLVSDSVASYFVFDLGGFEFLLDTIGLGSEAESQLQPVIQRKLSGEGGIMSKTNEVIEEVKVQEENSKDHLKSLEGSDLGAYLESTILEFQSQLKPSDSSAPIQAVAQQASDVVAPSGHYDKQTSVFVQEFSKNMTMVSSNGGDLPATYSKTDWSVNKRAYKHRIIIKHLVGQLRPEYWIMFQLPNVVELREIQIAFTNYWAADTEVYAEPLSVLVEAGLDENNLSLVCNLQLVKDDAFGSVSATVFGQNLQSFGTTTTTLSSSADTTQFVEELIQQKLSSLQNCKVQFIKFRMRRHVMTCLENSPLSNKFSKQAAFAINYISLLGFDMTKIGEFLSYIKQEQKKTALEILSIICSGDFASILKVIANQQQTIDKIKKSFGLLASLVSIKANLIEPTFIAISTYNTEMGDWIINQFLKSSRNIKHAFLVGEIVICNKAEMPRRLCLLKDFVMSQLRLVTQEERSQHGSMIKKILPFVKVFIQTLRIAAPDIEMSQSEGEFDLGTKETHLTDIISLLSGATQQREFQTRILTQLLVLLLCPPAPFNNTNIDALSFTMKYLLEDTSHSLIPTASIEENLLQKEQIASILSATRTLIAQEILNRGLKLEKLLNPGKGQAPASDDEKHTNLPLQHAIKFWLNVSSDQTVRSKLAEDKIPLKLYQVLRCDQPEKALRIVRKDTLINEQELDLMVELIKQLTAGVPSLEKELAAMLMKDLEHMSHIRDMNFVNKVFLQLLRIERTVPVCLWPYDSENKKWLSTFKPETPSENANQQQVSHNNFVPSSLLQGEKRSVFIKNFKEIVGQHSKGASKKLLGSHWTLAHSQTEQGQVSQFQGFWKNIENKSPIVALIGGTTASGSNVVFGCYCSKGVPSVPANLTQDSDYPVVSQPEDFVFCYIDENSFHHYAPKQGSSILSMFTDYEGGGAISIANDFMLMSFSYDFVFTVGTLYEVDKIQEENNPKPVTQVEGNSITFSKFEVWSPQQVAPVAVKDAISAPVAAAGLAKIQSTSHQLASSLSNDFNEDAPVQPIKHAWYNNLSPFIHYRTNPVFMVPAHLSLSQLSKIMLESTVSFKMRAALQIHSQSETIETLFQKSSEDKTSFEKSNCILDLEYELNQLLNVQQTASAVEESAADDQGSGALDASGQKVISGYVPKMGLFEQFEDQGGVKAIIQVTLQSLKLWKADEQAKSWDLWLKELESFSEIPLFFQLFLKNTRCKDLLFKVLAGLPDTEITAEGSKTEAKTRWDEEQKAAVQFNYKILSEAFSISTDIKLRETAMKCGLLPRILDRLGQISGEKPRVFDEDSKEEEQKGPVKVEESNMMQQTEKNTEKKKRKGVGYSSKAGVTFNVTQYLENKKQRNEQIKNLIDICSNFINCKEWKANEEVLNIILESPLLPLLESAFRNGSWLDMAKENEVYHSYLALARSIAQQKSLISCLVPIDPKYKPTQTEPIYKLLQKLNDLAEIFINCLNQQTKAEQPKPTNEESKQNSLAFPQPIQLTQPGVTTSIPHLINPSFENLPNITLQQFDNGLQVYPSQILVNSQYLNSLQNNNNKMESVINSKNLNVFNIDNKMDEKKSNPVMEMLQTSYFNHEKMHKNKKSLHQGLMKLNQSSSSNFSSQSLSEEEEKKDNLTNDYSNIGQTLTTFYQHKQSEQTKQKSPPPMASTLLQANHPQANSALSDAIKNMILQESWKQGITAASFVPEGGTQKQQASFFKKDPSEPKSPHSQQDSESQSNNSSKKSSEDGKDVKAEGSMLKDLAQLAANKFKQLKSSFQPLPITSSAKKQKKPFMGDSSSNSSSSKEGNQSDVEDSYETISQATIKTDEKPLEGQDDDDDGFETVSEESVTSEKTKVKTKLDNLKKEIDKKKNLIPLKKKSAKISSSSSSSSQSVQEESKEESDYDSEEDQSDDDQDETSSEESFQTVHTGDEVSEEGGNSELVRQRKAKQEQIDSEIPENLARDVIKTYKLVQSAVQKLLKVQKDENFIENALNQPPPQAYQALLQDLRFDYMDMKDPADTNNQLFKHHYQSVATQNQNPPPSKMVRLAQELADLSNALPYEHTNAIFVRVDQSRVDLMKALICGASNTPYAHGCYEFDIFCDNNYPRDPPKMNLITTGGGSVRFNPNLYACGKVCLSLLGTWRGSATENWDPKLSTILQVLLSTQAIIMSEEVYFNEPGFENEAGTPEGEKKNEGYQNIVRYCNIKFAMIGQIKKPSKGFESVIKRHFYIKKNEIMKEVKQWQEFSEKNEAAYTGLVNDHNYNWANQFKATKTKFKEMLAAAITELEDELNKLERPSDLELQLLNEKKRQHQKQSKKKQQAITEGKADLNDIDMDSDEEEKSGDEGSNKINTESGKKQEIDIEDEAVKDRWSRYIGAMGVEAVAKQSAANIFLSGAGSLGIEIAKNLVLAGCKSFTLHDYKPITFRDLSGQFFLNLEEDILNEKKKKATRGEACLHRLKQLNYYVKCQLAPVQPLPKTKEELVKEPWNFSIYEVIILTEATNDEIILVDNFCRSSVPPKKLVVADAYGVFTRVLNDFGSDKFEVLDKNGEELQDVMIKSITSVEGHPDESLVELLPNTKHKFEDGDEVIIMGVEGMLLKEGEKHDDQAVKSNSINDTIHKVKVVTPYAFKIGPTTKFTPYERNGIARQLKTKQVIKFKPLEEVFKNSAQDIPLDGNLAIADFEKMQNNTLAHLAFESLDIFRGKSSGRVPEPWNFNDCSEFLNITKDLAASSKYSEAGMKPVADWYKEDGSYELSFLSLFSLTCSGVFNPLCAFQGGVVAQEVVKAITQKFSPINQLFYYDAYEVLPLSTFKPAVHLASSDALSKFSAELYKEVKHRSDGLRIILGNEMIEKLAQTRLFMVGAGAIGCELLKNYAMLGVGTGKAQGKNKLGGQIVLTDPDVIEVSNLNRQFLFREKHLRKPKSSTAAAAAIYMNRELRENIVARLDKVHEGTANIFTDQFFEGLTVVTNALDNIHARRYIDARCVVARTPLLESGTLGPKGHVQVVLPHKTESYGSQNDPEDNTEIPHCTLKMFPEETLHCVEWARDKFGKIFTQAPTNAAKLLEESQSFQPSSQEDAKSLKEVVKLLERRPTSFNDCLKYARNKFEKFYNHDIRQLLHVYPLDSKTKEGAMFWSLPKRPPVPQTFDSLNPLHCQFITAISCLRAKVFNIEIPSSTPRTEEFRKYCGQEAAKISVPDFVPNDEKAKEIQASVNKEGNKDAEVTQEEVKEISNTGEQMMIQTGTASSDTNDIDQLMKRFHKMVDEIKPQKDKALINPEQFEKDNDQNFHIDVIYAMGNCRAVNYKLDAMDWITVKLKAGRIVPALATTTAAVAGLQTLELVKLLLNAKKADHRNIFLNLAVPIMQASEPGEIAKTKLAEGIEVTLWDRWDVNKGTGNKDVTLSEVIKQVQDIHKDVFEVRDVMRGNAPIYFHAIMNAKGKEADKEKIMNSKVAELANIDPSEDKYVDLNITCVLAGDQEDKILSGVPPVRVYFE